MYLAMETILHIDMRLLKILLSPIHAGLLSERINQCNLKRKAPHLIDSGSLTRNLWNLWAYGMAMDV